MMQDHGIRHLLVLDGGKLVGVVSERDLALIHQLPPTAGEPFTVEHVMTPEPYAVPAHTGLNRVVREMARRKCGSTVVTEGSAYIGIFTTIDALGAFADALEGKHARSEHEARASAPERGAIRR